MKGAHVDPDAIAAHTQLDIEPFVDVAGHRMGKKIDVMPPHVAVISL
jgi:hypothetical protein